MMAPTIALHGDCPELILGSGGSKRIRTAILQVLINLIDFNLPVEKAVLAPRLHWDGEVLQMEPGFSSQAQERLGRNFPLNIWQQSSLYFGGVHAIASGYGCGDPRRGGDSRILTLSRNETNLPSFPLSS